jgi:hypothetical protein
MGCSRCTLSLVEDAWLWLQPKQTFILWFSPFPLSTAVGYLQLGTTTYKGKGILLNRGMAGQIMGVAVSQISSVQYVA